MGTKPSATPQGRQPGVGHEQTDARAGWIFGILFFLGISGLALHFIVAGLQNAFQTQSPPSDRWPAMTQARKSATAWTNRFPPLQVSPPVDLDAFHAREEDQLSSYGWVNRTAGIVHIPITQAMDVVAKHGLPTREGTNRPAIGPSSWELQQQRAAKEGK
jgi:hypothetical protein